MRNLPNALSLSRMLSTLPIVILVLTGLQVCYLIALCLFAVFSVSDLLDGYIARRYAVTSRVGVFLDLTADKVLVSGVLIAMIQTALIPAWIVLIIITREFLITGLRSLAAAEGIVFPAGKWGKQKTTITLVGMGFLLLAKGIGAATPYYFGFGIAAPGMNASLASVTLMVSYGLILLAVIWTVLSAINYTVHLSVYFRAKSEPNIS